ncbi:hypothetical protein QL285_001198 [Trifolium repens]|nr:hypothetical protein QL285_001198 [Trifolium repens]
MAFENHFTLFALFFFSFNFLSTTTTLADPHPLEVDVTIRNDFPVVLTFNCNQLPPTRINVGAEYKGIFPYTGENVECYAAWSRYSLTWVAYVYKGDALSHWSAREDGLYYSPDAFAKKKHYKLFQHWETK